MLYSFPSLTKATVLKRPSATIKSPYVADIRFEDGTTSLCHTPGLGCCGLVESGRSVYVSRSRDGAKTDYTTQLAICEDVDGPYYVGIHPMVSQNAAHSLLSTICSDAQWKSEVTVGDSRFDYVGSCPNGKTIYLEVKTAMVSLGLDKARSERRALFPVGYKKKKGDPVSPRAIKHAEGLAALAQEESTHSCILVFLVPRSDCGGGFEVNREDPAYYAAVKKAIYAGVQVRAYALDYTPAGITLHDEVPVYIDLL